MFKNMKLGMQITLGFAMVLILLVVLSIIAYSGLKGAVDGFTDYRGLARDANLAGRVQANMLLVRLYAKDYILKKNDKAVQQFKKRHSTLSELVAEAEKEIQKPERAEKVKSIKVDIVDYDKAFDKVVGYMKQRDEVVKNRLDPNGLAMRKSITSIMESAFKDQDPEAAFYAGELQESLLLARLYVAKYLSTNLQADAERAHKELNQKVAERSKKLDENIQNPQRRKHLAEFNQAHEIYASALDEINKIITERNAVIKGELDRIGPEVADASEAVKLSVKKDQDILGPKVQQENENTVNFVVWISIGALVIGLILSWILVRVIKRPLGGEPADMERIARSLSDGDLQVQFENGDSATGVYSAMYGMVNNLRNIVSKVREGSDRIGSAASEIAKGNLDLSQRTEEQASSLEETASSMEEMTSTVKQNADNARQANQLAISTSEQAEKGGKVVSQAVAAMGEITDSSKKIADIISVIDEIAFQTNLLALNAAVEAARAGEQGRGFAVVASEVRTLAGRSADAAKEIKDLITDSVDKVEQGSELVDASGKTLEEIVTSVKKVTDIISEIAASSQEQATGIEQVNNAVMQMDEMTQQNAALVEEASAASKSMEEQSQGLMNEMAFFKLEAGRAMKSVSNASSSSAVAAQNAQRPSPQSLREDPPEVVEARAKLAEKKAAPVRSAKTGTDDAEWDEF